MVNTNPSPMVFENQSLWRDAAVAFINDAISTVLKSNGKVSIALSGGSTPAPIYEAVSSLDLAWDGVTATLVDERITDDPNGLNMTMIRSQLQQNRARNITLKTPNSHVGRGVDRAYDLCVMGMGTDGHTASWFPGSRGLMGALDPYGEQHASSIDARGCSGAGAYPNRVSLTLPAVMSSKSILLLMTGQEKRDIFEKAALKDVYAAPVKTLFAAGPRLTVMWAP